MFIVGEKLNSVIGPVKAAIEARDEAFVVDLARRQLEAGATYLDVNTGMAGGNEAESMTWMVKTIQNAMDAPLCIDSTDPKTIEGALQVHKGRAMVNSITGEKKRLAGILPLVVSFGSSVVALAMDDRGIPSTAAGRFAALDGLIPQVIEAGVSREDIYVDSLVLPVGVDGKNAAVFFDTLREVKTRYGVKTISGLSNVSYSLPKRKLINRHFLTIAMSLGMDAAILDPLDGKIQTSIAVTDLLMGHDKGCRGYLKRYRSGTLEE